MFRSRASFATCHCENRIGHHICYFSDLTKMRDHYPCWDITISLKETIEQIVAAWKRRVEWRFIRKQ